MSNVEPAKKLLGFDFDADRFARCAPHPIEIPKKNPEILEEIIKKHGNPNHKPPDQEDLRRIYHLFIDTPPNRLLAEFDTLRHSRRLAWALTVSEGGLPQIVDTPQLHNALQLIENHFQINALLGVFNTLLQAWDRPNAGLLRKFVKKHLTNYDGPLASVQKLKANMVWYCEANSGTQLAKKLLGSQVKLSDIWSNLELPGHTYGYRYFGVVAEEYVALNRHLDQEDVADVVEFVKKHNNNKTSRTVLSKIIKELGIDADPNLREPAQSYILQAWRDPRVATGAVRWGGVSDEVRQIFTKWITKDHQSLFDVGRFYAYEKVREVNSQEQLHAIVYAYIMNANETEFAESSQETKLLSRSISEWTWERFK